VRIHLIRHPPPAVPPGICYGRSDLPLVEDPAACAARLRTQLPQDIPVFTSPLRRCLALAEALHARPIIDERLTEMDFGAWEMRAWDDIPRSEIDAWSAAPLDYAPPGGKPVAVLLGRVRTFLSDRRADGCSELAVVTHAGVMKLFAAELLDLPIDNWLPMTFKYSEIFVIDAAL
jgi:alpha-ribazole phosphatase